MSLSTNFGGFGGIHAQCNHLIHSGLRDHILLPGQESYNNRVDSWWSATARLKPYCIIQPTTADDVSKAVVALKNAGQGSFAVRSGGHSHWAGGSNIEEGVTIDLGLFNGTTYNAEEMIASIGPGAKWTDVFIALERDGVIVPGGRDGNVGVGGFVTGGGISYFTGRQGLACDALVGAEVVLADGSIVNVNNASHPDLFKSLKGGSGNFGIVTRLDLMATKAGPIWGGMRASSAAEVESLVNFLVEFTDSYDNHPETAFLLNFGFQPSISSEVIMAYMMVDTNGADSNPVFDSLRDIPELVSDLKMRPTSGIASDYLLPSGRQNVWHTLTFKNDARIVRKAGELHEHLVTQLRQTIPAEELMTQSIFQPIPKLFSDIGMANGGNVLGLDKLDGNALLWLCVVAVKSTEHEPLVAQKLAIMAAELESYAESIGVMIPWVYLNYADPSQDPITAYGEENLKFLWEVSNKFDPTGLFQKRMRSGFKLPKI